MGPHPDHLYDPLVPEDLVHKSMLNVDPARIGARQITSRGF